MFFDPFDFLPFVFSTGFLILGILVINNPSLEISRRGTAQ